VCFSQMPTHAVIPDSWERLAWYFEIGEPILYPHKEQEGRLVIVRFRAQHKVGLASTS
jgi:hypothetical protein